MVKNTGLTPEEVADQKFPYLKLPLDAYYAASFFFFHLDLSKLQAGYSCFK